MICTSTFFAIFDYYMPAAGAPLPLKFSNAKRVEMQNIQYPISDKSHRQGTYKN